MYLCNLANLSCGHLHSWLVGAHRCTVLWESNLTPCRKQHLLFKSGISHLGINLKSLLGGPFISQSFGFFLWAEIPHPRRVRILPSFMVPRWERKTPLMCAFGSRIPTRPFIHTLDSLSPRCLLGSCFCSTMGKMKCQVQFRGNRRKSKWLI